MPKQNNTIHLQRLNTIKKMTKKFGFLSFCLLNVLLLLPINSAHSQEALIVHKTGGTAAKSFVLDNIQRISFSGDNLSVKLLDGNDTAYALDDVAKLTFGDIIITDVKAPSAPNQLEIVVYATSPGEIVVKSSVTIQSLTLFNVDGKILHNEAVETLGATSLQTTFNISTLPTGVYLLRIKTEQGTVVKKITKK